MFDRFTDRARKAIGLARHEAQRFNHDFIGPEHVLLGLVREGGGVGATALQRLGLDLGAVRVELERRLTPGARTVTFGQLPFTADAKQLLERSLEEASRLGHTYIGTEHLLLGLLRVEAGVAAQVLATLGVRLDAARAEITKLLGEGEPPADAPRTQGPDDPVFDRLTKPAGKALFFARRDAQRRGCREVRAEHLLLGLLEVEDGIARAVLAQLGVDAARLATEVAEAADPGVEPAPAGYLPLSEATRDVLSIAGRQAAQMAHGLVGTAHLLLALLVRGDSPAAQALGDAGLRVDDLREAIVELFQATPALDGPTEGARRPSGIVHEPLARPTEREHATPELDAYTVDVARTLAAAPGTAVVGRDALLDRVVDVLHRRARPNVLLVGPPGVGKTAVVDELARRCATGPGAGRLTGCRVVRLDVPALVAGTKYRGQLEERARRLLAALRGARNVVVHVEDARLLATSGFSTESLKVAEALAPLVRGEVGAMILTMTPEAAAPTLERLGVAHYFTTVEVAEPEPAAAHAMVAAHRDLLAAHHGVEVTDDAIDVAIAGGLTLVHRHLPSSALDLLDETCARVARRGPASPRPVVDAAAVRATLAAARPPER
ncbi:MAG: Clp protease N-terminal domain-containing protein [Planctomycetota bacterium]